ncbi:GNAT family N-acetyltransferase [Solilutibacter pythonis]|nr:GNAT family N-acetyltransferase [Lysobacter pythonis]
MHIHIDKEAHANDFARLNEQWIREHFRMEDSDHALLADPLTIIRNGGHMVSLTDNGRVVGVCALLKDPDGRYELAKMAVDPGCRGRGFGSELIEAATALARAKGASSLYLISNVKLAPAISLYEKHGFVTTHLGPHPSYERADIIMEKEI